MAGSKFPADDIEQNASFIAQLEGTKQLLAVQEPAPKSAPSPSPSINIGLN